MKFTKSDMELFKAVAIRVAGRTEASKDIAQQLFIKLYDIGRLDLLDKPKQLEQWCFITARNMVVDEQRKKKVRRLARPFEFESINTPDLQWVKSKLNHVERMWLDRYYKCDLSYVKMAQMIGCSRQCASRKITQIKIKIQKHYDLLDEY